MFHLFASSIIFLFYYTYQEVKLLPSAPFAGSGSPLSIIPPPPPPVLIAYGFDVLIPGMAAFCSGFCVFAYMLLKLV